MKLVSISLGWVPTSSTVFEAFGDEYGILLIGRDVYINTEHEVTKVMHGFLPPIEKNDEED